MSLALACDVILADKNTYLTELFVGIGLLPDAGSMYFLPRMIGTQKTFEEGRAILLGAVAEFLGQIGMADDLKES